MAKSLQIRYFNTIYLKHTPVPKLEGGSKEFHSSTYDGLPWYHSNRLWGGPPWIDFKENNALGTPGPGTNAYTLNDFLGNSSNGTNFVTEESRIRGGFNNAIMDLSPRAFLVEKENKVRIRENTMIYSGVFNSRTGVNNSNVFAAGTEITKSVDKNLGSIQKLFSTDNSLNIFQENKVSQAMVDKDAIYTQEGQPLTTASNVVIGAIQPYVGEYGISKNPESFASFGFRRYFADKYRNSIMRLSRDGLTEISQYGMKDYFRDKLKLVSDFRRPVVSSVFPIATQWPGIPPLNPGVYQATKYVQVTTPTDTLDTNLISQGSNVSIYMVGGYFDTTMLLPCDSQGNVVASSGSGYDSVTTYATNGGSGSGFTTTVTVNGSGGITGVGLAGAFSGTAYSQGDIISVFGGNNDGYLVAENINSVIDNGSGVWYTLDHFVTGLTYKPNGDYNLVFTTGGNYGKFGQNGVEYPATKIRFLEYRKDRIEGGYDVHKSNYLISLKRQAGSKTANEVSDYRNNIDGTYSTAAFDENVKGWTTFYTFRPDLIFSQKNTFFTTKENQLYSHYTELTSTNTFYGVKKPSLVEFIFNTEPSINKNFKTINYEGDNGWQVSSMASNFTGPIGNLNLDYFDSSSGIKSYNRTDQPDLLMRSSFKLKEGKYVANIINTSSVRDGEVIFGEDMTGLKGYFINVVIATDEFTEPQSRKELFAVSTEFAVSSR